MILGFSAPHSAHSNLLFEDEPAGQCTMKRLTKDGARASRAGSRGSQI
jgi:hypothetical protein